MDWKKKEKRIITSILNRGMRYKLLDFINAAKDDDVYCPQCDDIVNDREFKSKDGKFSYEFCRECREKYNKNYYEKNVKPKLQAKEAKRLADNIKKFKQRKAK